MSAGCLTKCPRWALRRRLTHAHVQVLVELQNVSAELSAAYIYIWRFAKTLLSRLWTLRTLCPTLCGLVRLVVSGGTLHTLCAGACWSLVRPVPLGNLVRLVPLRNFLPNAMYALPASMHLTAVYSVDPHARVAMGSQERADFLL